MAKNYNVQFSEGETFYFNFKLRDAAGLPLDLTGALVEWAVAALDGSGTTLLATSANNLITITSATEGLGTVSVSPDDHADIISGEYTHELRVTLADATVSMQITGSMTVGDSIFPAVGTGFTRSTGLRLVYDNIIVDADPGDGQFRLNNADPESATYIYVDLADHYDVSITSWLAVLDDSTTDTPRGFLRFTKVNLESVWYEYAITGAVESASGYRKIPVSFVAGAGDITNGNHFAVTFARTGDQGSAGVLADGDKGDIIVSSAGTVWGIDSTVITTYARSFLDDTTEAAFKATVNLEIGIDVLAYDTGVQQIADLADPNADRVLFWDDSAGEYLFLTMGANLTITGTTLNASVTGATLADGDYGDIVVSGSGVVMSIDAGVIVNADINASAAIDATKIADGSVTSTEFQYISTLSSNAQTQINNVAIQNIIIACSDETTALTTGTGKVTFRMPFAMTLTDVRASVTTAPTGATLLTVDVNDSGSTILSTKLTFDASEKTTTTASTPRVISDSALADDAEITIDIDAVGNTIAGAGLKVYLIGTKT